jgi:histidyl-tRNA synthetase
VINLKNLLPKKIENSFFRVFYLLYTYMKYTIARGTKDILPNELALWNHIETTAKDIFKLYNFKEIRTPIFEPTQLFTRAIRESDIVQKEMYTFKDKGDRDLALRPEGTAPIARAYLSNNLAQDTPESKLFYIGPMFRYERPQAGRYRQFHQIGVESIGASHAYSDAEIIALSYRLFTELGLKNVKIHINSVGSETCRPVIEARIIQFLAANITQLSESLQEKFKTNPLKLLDSKDKKLQTYLSGLPDLREALSQKSKDHFNNVLSYLDYLDIPFEYKPNLVRGLDYYTETVFEVVSEDLGAQNSICGGGRYNNLISDLGGPSTPAVGFAFGLERIVMLMQKQNLAKNLPSLLIYIAPLAKEYQIDCVHFAENLRNKGFSAITNYTKFTISNHIKLANKENARYMIIYGENEEESKTVLIKDLSNRTQENVSQSKIINYFEDLNR